MKRRIVLAIAGVAACAVTLFALPLGITLQRGYRVEELLRLQRDTVAATRGIDLTSAGADPVELPRSDDRLAIYNAAGTRIAGRGPAAGDAIARSALASRRPTGASRGGTLVVAVPLLSGERVTGVVRAERSQAAVARRTHRAWLELGGLAAGLVLIAALAALALGRRLARPLENLGGVARRVAEGDFSARAQPTDIREIDDLGAALNHSTRHIDELVTRERTFSANASHQLRTPLAALRLELEGLALGAAEEPPELTAALAQVDRLQTTIGTLLAVARGTPQAEQTSDLGAIVRDLADRWHGPLAAAGRPLRVTVDLGGETGAPAGGTDEPPLVAMSPTVLREIADVLMQNAQTHGAGAVSLTVRRIGAALALEVADRGTGFGADPEAAFTRGTGDGDGIGLALARSLADADGARLQITRAGPSPAITLLVPCASR
jgi:signal transduction histidine kinase